MLIESNFVFRKLYPGDHEKKMQNSLYYPRYNNLLFFMRTHKKKETNIRSFVFTMYITRILHITYVIFKGILTQNLLIV